MQSDLAALLRQPTSLDVDWVLPGDYAERAWIVADDSRLCYTVSPARRQHFRLDLARVLAVPPGRLTLCPARPPIHNQAYRGQLVRHLYVATGIPAPLPRAERAPICLLDLRPILLSFSWYFAPAGVLQVAPLLERFAPRAPEGFALGFSRDDGPIERLHRPLAVEDGDVIGIHLFVPPPEDISSTDSDDDMRPPTDALPQPAGDLTDGASSQSPGLPPAAPAGASAPRLLWPKALVHGHLPGLCFPGGNSALLFRCPVCQLCGLWGPPVPPCFQSSSQSGFQHYS